MPAIGIMGGMGPQASCKLYELLIEGTKQYNPEASKNSDYPEIILLSIPLPNIISDTNLLPEAEQMMLERTQLLEQAGSIVNGIACNTTHIMLPKLQAATSVPFLSMPALVAAYAARAGYTRIGLLATPTTLASTIYDTALAGVAEVIRPDEGLATHVEEIIYRRLHGDLPEAERQQFRDTIADFRREHNLDAVILGCTELPLVYGDTNAEPEIIDTLQVLADALLSEYYARLNDKNLS